MNVRFKSSIEAIFETPTTFTKRPLTPTKELEDWFERGCVTGTSLDRSDGGAAPYPAEVLGSFCETGIELSQSDLDII